MKASSSVIVVLVLGAFHGSVIADPPGVTEEISIGFLPLEWVTSTLRKTLSPDGRYKIPGATGSIRISDRAEKIDAARRALDELQKAPAIVPIEINFVTTTYRTVQRAPASPASQSYGIPVPSHYSPPRIVGNPGGPMVVIPSQPRSFTTRKTGPETIVNPEVRQNETRVTRRFSASVALGKPVILTVLKNTPDAAALRALALRQRAIPESEPAWTVAGTELLVRSEMSSGHLLVNIVPQIVIPNAASGQGARHIALPACAASVLVARGAPISTGTLPHADAEFYRLFLGAQEAAKDAVTALRIAARVQYVGGPPK